MTSTDTAIRTFASIFHSTMKVLVAFLLALQGIHHYTFSIFFLNSIFFSPTGLLVATENTPVFSDQYVANGRILLPYAEIDENFVAYYSLNTNKSRVDYYGDLMVCIIE